MRRRVAVCCLVLVSLSAFGMPQDYSQPKTIEGCVVGVNGAFRLSTANGETYMLQGDHSTLLSYNGMQVRVTGTVKKPPRGTSTRGAPRTLKVSDIKKVSQTCQF